MVLMFDSRFYDALTGGFDGFDVLMILTGGFCFEGCIIMTEGFVF